MDFSHWKQKLQEPPEEWIRNPRDGAYDTYEYIGDTKVIIYPGNGYFTAGLWLQKSDRRICVYYREANPKHPVQGITFIDFHKEKEDGPVHKHNFIELGFVIQGCARQSFSGKEYLFHEGDFWITDRNCYHNDIYFDEELFTAYISIPSEIFDGAFLESISESEIQYFIYNALLNQKKTRQFLHFTPCNSDNHARELLLQIFRELFFMEIGFQNVVKGLLSRLLAVLSLEYEYFLTIQQKTKMNQLLYREIEEYMRENYKTVTIQQLVKKFHYNEDFYNRLIKECRGLTYSEFLQKIRLSKAEELLRTTKLSVDGIALQVGYENKGHFYRVFFKHYKVTPGQYRKQH